MNLSSLPDIIINKIFLYLQNPEAKLIKDRVEVYEKDHNWGLTKYYRMYYIKNILSFSEYYFDYKNEPHEYDSYHINLYDWNYKL